MDVKASREFESRLLRQLYCCNPQFCFINNSFSINTDGLSHLGSSFFIPSFPLLFFKVTKILSKSVKIFYVIPDLITVIPFLFIVIPVLVIVIPVLFIVIPAKAGIQEHASVRAQRSNLLS